MEGIEPEGSSSATRSTRCIGKNTVGNPTRSPSGSFIWRMKWSNEFRSMPRSVTPEGLMASNSPHTFSLGVCRLTITMECGSIVKGSYTQTNVFRPTFGRAVRKDNEEVQGTLRLRGENDP